MLQREPATKPPNERVAKFFTAFLIALACFSGTSSEFDIKNIGNYYAVI